MKRFQSRLREPFDFKVGGSEGCEAALKQHAHNGDYFFLKIVGGSEGCEAALKRLGKRAVDPKCLNLLEAVKAAKRH